MGKKVVAIVGSYRKGGTIDTAVEAIMAGARDNGAQTHTVYLTEQHIEFCSNCRSCTQTPGPERGKCPQRDDMEPILAEIETADAIVLASPVNCGNVTAIFRRFLERLMGCAYWPWGQSAPTPRSKLRTQKAILGHAGNHASYLYRGLDCPADCGQSHWRENRGYHVDWTGGGQETPSDFSTGTGAGAAHRDEAGLMWLRSPQKKESGGWRLRAGHPKNKSQASDVQAIQETCTEYRQPNGMS